MRQLFDALSRHAIAQPDAIAFSDAGLVLPRATLRRRIAGLVVKLLHCRGHVGILAPNGAEWAVAQLACAMAGKVTVPLPTFFSRDQLGHIVRDAEVRMLLATQETWPIALRSCLPALIIGTEEAAFEQPADGFGQIIYTSGSTGHPKGVRHESGQLAWSMSALAAATGAQAPDRYLSVLPLPLLLETLCAVFIPALVGASTRFDRVLADAVGRGQVDGIARAFESAAPTMSVLVPQLLKLWVSELTAMNQPAPASLRFVAAGGAAVPSDTAQAAWERGIPLHEGYGLSECCSVVAVNRPGDRRPGTVGRAIQGLDVSIVEGEIVVDGPSIMDGYSGQAAPRHPFRTGDLGSLDADGYLTVFGRKDNLIITSYGRNISPEWIETMILGDPRVFQCAVVGNNAEYLSALIIPSSLGADWLGASASNAATLVRACCAGAPAYAVPQSTVVLSFAEAAQHRLLTGNGRIKRAEVAAYLKHFNFTILQQDQSESQDHVVL